MSRRTLSRAALAAAVAAGVCVLPTSAALARSVHRLAQGLAQAPSGGGAAGSAVTPQGPGAAGRSGSSIGPGRDLATLAQLFAGLHRCWRPPPKNDAFPGMQITLRFSLTRNGDINGEPRVTYMSPGAPRSAQIAYQRAAAAALARCLPLPLTPGLGDAVAGRPLTIRFTDERGLRRARLPLLHHDPRSLT